MDVSYILLESQANRRIYYGIAAVERCDGSFSILRSYTNLCADQSRVTAFVDLCNRQRLSLIHLPEVVEDFLACL